MPKLCLSRLLSRDIHKQPIAREKRENPKTTICARGPGGGEGGLPYETDGDVRRLA